MDTYATLALAGYVPTLDAFAAESETHLHLYTNDPPLSEGMTAADFDELVMVGYTPLAALKYTPAALRDGRAFAVADPFTWRYTTGAVPPPVRGVYATVGLDGPIQWAWRTPGDAFAIGPASPVLSVVLTLLYPAPVI